MYRIITVVFRYLAVLVITFASTASIAVGGNEGVTVLGMGGGSIEEATFVSGVQKEVTFSFFAGFDNQGNPQGSFHFRSGSQNGKVDVVLSTEITDIQAEPADEENDCAAIKMTGIAKFVPRWKTEPPRNPRQAQLFTLIVQDCDSYSDEPVTDMIWFEVKNSGGGVRPGLSLEDLFAVKGNILIR